MPTGNRPLRSILASVTAFTLLAAACGGGDGGDGGGVGETATSGAPEVTDAPDDSGQEPSDTSATGDAATASTTATVPPPAQQTYGGTITYATFGETTGFDPARPGLGWCDTAIFDTLMKFDDRGIAQPFLAESMTSDDSVTWLLTLREGIQFHDGTPLDAAAVAFNTLRHKDPALASPLAGVAEQIVSVTAVDDLTVEYVLSEPLSAFPTLLAAGTGLGTIMSPTAINELGEDVNLNPVGVGPFEFVEWIPDDRLVLQRNESYWQEGLPYLDELICRPLPDTLTRYQAVANGDVDMAYMISANEIVQAEEDPNLVALSAKANGAEAFLLNDNRPPFDDPRMREAFVRLLNPDAIAQIRHAGQRELAGTEGIVADTDGLYNPDVAELWPDYDPDIAGELIESYRADGGDPSFTVIYPNFPDLRPIGDALVQFFAQAGLDTQAEFLDISEYYTGVLLPAEFQAAITSMPAFVGMYPNVFNAYHTDGSSNFGDYSSEEMDAALATAISTGDDDEAATAWQEVQRIAAVDLPVATFGRPPTAILTQPYVAGVEKYPNNTVFFATISRE